jgi:phosphoribosylglycinamide formyltransferase 1
VSMAKPNGNLRLAVLISGSGRTLKNILDEINADRLDAEVVMVVSNKPSAGGLQFAENASPVVPTCVVQRTDHDSIKAFSDEIFAACHEAKADYIVMAGFLCKISIPSDFENKVLNIHPSLIPAFCGKSYYGHRVHEAAIEYGVKLSGCTVHFVNDEYDAGPVILQRKVAIDNDETPDSLAAKVFEQEMIAYPETLRLLADDRIVVEGRKVIVLPEEDDDDEDEDSL